MTVQHIDIYHCQKCGELIYGEHDAPPPRCCRVEMVRAVSDILSEIEDEQLLAQHEASDTAEGRRHSFPPK